MTKSELLLRLQKVEQLAISGKWRRFVHNPYKYLWAIIYRRLIYPIRKASIERDAVLFFGEKMKVRLPASTDIYLLGAKSHLSEIRLSKFLVRELAEGDCFVDVGTHFGYFTMLAVYIVGEEGKIFSFEASQNNYELLRKNANQYAIIEHHHKAVSNKNGTISFFEFPNIYSEYNTINADQFAENNWYKKIKPKERRVDTIALGSFLKNKNQVPKIIKIDVEGAEYSVILGMKDYLKAHAPYIVMEYLAPSRGNQEHRKATDLLSSLQYESYSIAQDGTLHPCLDIEAYLLDKKEDSDNIVFKTRIMH